MNILFIGDVVGRPGRTAITSMLPDLIRQYEVDFTIANAENAAGGYGLTPDIATELLAAGADCLTSGNHIWAQKAVYRLLDEEPRVLRPANYPAQAPGQGAAVFTAADDTRVGVVNLLGRIFMTPVDCPFRRGQDEIKRLVDQAEIIIVDFHAEATSEKRAMGFFMDGRVAAVVGTHTHVQAADEQILPAGTAYITDCGMTGPVDTVIGVDKQTVINGFLTRLPQRFEVPKTGPCLISGIVIKCNRQSGLAEAIFRINVPYPASQNSAERGYPQQY